MRMTSILIAYLLMCAIFWGICLLPKGREREYSFVECIVYYIGTRIYPAIYLLDIHIWKLLGLELILILSFGFVIGKKLNARNYRRICVFYLFQPVTIYYIATGKILYLLLNELVLVIIFWGLDAIGEYIREYILICNEIEDIENIYTAYLHSLIRF